MGWTKEQFVRQAYAELALADYDFDLQPEEVQDGLRRLDSMMATWNGKGIRLAYPVSPNPDDIDGDQDSNVPDAAREAVYSNLAIRLAPGKGKQLSQDTRNTAKEGYDMLISRAAMPNQIQFPQTMPRGSGNKPWRNINDQFMPRPCDGILAGDDGPIEFD